MAHPNSRSRSCRRGQCGTTGSPSLGSEVPAIMTSINSRHNRPRNPLGSRENYEGDVLHEVGPVVEGAVDLHAITQSGDDHHGITPSKFERADYRIIASTIVNVLNRFRYCITGNPRLPLLHFGADECHCRPCSCALSCLCTIPMLECMPLPRVSRFAGLIGASHQGRRPQISQVGCILSRRAVPARLRLLARSARALLA